LHIDAEGLAQRAPECMAGWLGQQAVEVAVSDLNCAGHHFDPLAPAVEPGSKVGHVQLLDQPSVEQFCQQPQHSRRSVVLALSQQVQEERPVIGTDALDELDLGWVRDEVYTHHHVITSLSLNTGVGHGLLGGQSKLRT
jgi:hypothetical protein